MKSVSKKTGVGKKAARDRRILAKARREDGERPLPQGRVEAAAKRAGIKSEEDFDETPMALPRHEIQRLARLLERASDSALKAAPRQIPQPGWGMAAALAAHDDIRMVREVLALALTVAS